MREVGSLSYIQPRVCPRLSSRRKVPSGVLSVLPGPGATTGKELVSHPLIRKVDITVSPCYANYLARL
jgi:acyl-CoA reductase-like NAD-dependent aldehyde dehydrogenase